MKSWSKVGWVLGFVGTIGAGCNAPGANITDAPRASAASKRGTRERGEPETTRDVSESAALSKALRTIDIGGDLGEAERALDKVIADEDATRDDKDLALIGKSKVREAAEDHEGAVAAVEQVLEAHPPGDAFDAHDVAAKRLRKLLTGTAVDGDHAYVTSEKYAPVSKALAAYFQPDEKNHTAIDIQVFGDAGATRADELGVYNISGAKRDVLRDACPLCDQNIDLSRSVSRSASWLSIPQLRGDGESGVLDRSLLVFFFDLGENLVPSRYDDLLPIPSDEIVGHLKNGEGVIAVRERPNGKPTIVIAAPRAGQLGAMTETFSNLTEIPKTPIISKVSPSLEPGEIKGVIQAAKSQLRLCYDTLLKRVPSAAGNVTFKILIAADGSVSSVQIDESKSTLKDAELEKCTLGVMSGLKFPPSDKSLIVVYPLVFNTSP